MFFIPGNITWKRETRVASLAPPKTLLGQNTQPGVGAKSWNQFLFFCKWTPSSSLKLVSRTCFVSLSGSLSTQDYCRQGRAITENLDLGGGVGVGEQGRHVSISPGGEIFTSLGEHIKPSDRSTGQSMA